MLFPDTINDLVWGTKGYKGLLNIQSKYNVDVYYKEGVKTEEDIINAIEDFHKRGVNLLYAMGVNMLRCLTWSAKIIQIWNSSFPMRKRKLIM